MAADKEEQSCFENITKVKLNKIHETQLKKGENNKMKTFEIVNVLGGIDEILTNYLVHDDIILNHRTLQQIHQIIRNSTIKTPKNHHIELLFVKEDSFLHSLFGNKKASKILNILQHKISEILLIVSLIIWMILKFTLWSNIIYPIYKITMCCTVWLPYLIFYGLSVNKEASKLIIKSFEFWLKTGYGIVLSIAHFVYFYYLRLNDLNYPYLRVIGQILQLGFGMTLSIVLISSFDGFSTNRKWKIIISGFMTFIFTFYSIYYQFFTFSNVGQNNISIIVISEGIQFSLITILVNAYRVISLFMFYQCFSTLIYGDYASIITFSPYLKWRDSKQQNQSLEMHSIISSSTINTD